MGNIRCKYNEKRIYYQWLEYIKPFPIRLDRVVMPVLWTITGLLAVGMLLWFAGSSSPYWFSISGIRTFSTPIANAVMYGIAGVAFLSLWVLMFNDFLYIGPLIIQKDTDKGFFPSLSTAPVSTNEILWDLRKWMMVLSFKHMLPGIFMGICVAVMLLAMEYILYWNREIIPDVLRLYTYNYFLPIVIGYTGIWIFFLTTGLAAASLPRWVSLTGMSMIFWVVPILAAVVYVVVLQAEEVAMILFGNDVIEMDNFFILGPNSNREIDMVPLAGAITGFVLLMVPSIFLTLITPSIMDRRRKGSWR